MGFPGSAAAQEILTWQDCLREAQKNHPDLISAQENIEESKAGKKITESSIFPQVTSSISAKRSQSSGKTTDTYSYSGTGTQLLFDGLKTANNINAASENLKAAQYQYRYTSSQVRYRLRSAFINLLRAQELLGVMEDIVKLRRKNLVLITLSYESGLEHKGALLTAGANLAQAEFEQAQAKRNIEVVQYQLAKELGRDAFAPLAVRGDFNVNEADLAVPDFETLVKENPYLQQLTAKENAAAFGIKSAYGEFSPAVSAQAGAGQSGSDWPPGDDQWNAGLTVSMPLFEGGSRIAQVEQAKAVFRQAQEDKRSSRDNTIVTLKQTWADLQDAVETVRVRQKSLAAAEERSRIAEAQYSIGFISYDNWSIIEDNLVQAKKSFLDAQANALLAQASWVQAKGDTVEYAQ